MKTILYYIHDPMCSWCWGFSKTWHELLQQLPEELEVQRLLGGLAPDSDEPMPESMKQAIKANWSRIQDTIPGVKFNFDFWDKTIPRRSTYPACRAVIAAREFGDNYDVEMTQAIQKAYYLQARNPSDYPTLIQLADELGLDKDKFSHLIKSDEIEEKLQQEIMFCRDLFVESYPSLVFCDNDTCHAIEINYNDSEKMLQQIQQYLAPN